MRIGHRAINLCLPMFGAIDKAAEIGYDGWVCIERESGEDRIGDAISGLALLRSLIESADDDAEE